MSTGDRRAGSASRARNDGREVFAVGSPVASEDHIVGALLCGYGERAAHLPTCTFVRHGWLVEAYRWLVNHGGVRREYSLRGHRVVLTIPRLAEALSEIGAPSVERYVEVAEGLMRKLPLATPADVHALADQTVRRRARALASEIEQRLAAGDSAFDLAEDLQRLLGELA